MVKLSNNTNTLIHEERNTLKTSICLRLYPQNFSTKKKKSNPDTFQQPIRYQRNHFPVWLVGQKFSQLGLLSLNSCKRSSGIYGGDQCTYFAQENDTQPQTIYSNEITFLMSMRYFEQANFKMLHLGLPPFTEARIPDFERS